MTGFNRGDKVLLGSGLGNAIGTVDKLADDDGRYTVVTLSGRRFSAVADDEMRLLPTGAPAFQYGTRVRIHADAPRRADDVGETLHAEFIDRTFGYWILLDSNERTWIPASALDPIQAGDPR